MATIERRAGELVQSEPGKVVGYAAVFGPFSEDLGGFRERVDPGAFDRSLKEGRDIRALIDHDTAKVLGRSSVDTLRLAKDDRGLRVEINLPDTSYARDLRALMERGDVSQMSFAFLLGPDGDKWEGRGDDGLRIRTLLDVELIEVSIVTLPAYPDTTAAVRSLKGLEESRRARELWMAKNRVRRPG
jgi:HK97 family phage prohead protease